jgi:hypothetical protein
LLITHIFNLIANGRNKKLYVGLYGDPFSEGNRQIISLAEGLKSNGREYPLDIECYDSESAKNWG